MWGGGGGFRLDRIFGVSYHLPFGFLKNILRLSDEILSRISIRHVDSCRILQ